MTSRRETAELVCPNQSKPFQVEVGGGTCNPTPLRPEVGTPAGGTLVARRRNWAHNVGHHAHEAWSVP